MESKQYKTPAVFRRALEDRLQAIAKKEGLICNDCGGRLLSTAFACSVVSRGRPETTALGAQGRLRNGTQDEGCAVYKGHRPKDARRFSPAHTKGESEKHGILTRLQDIAARNCGDFFVFTVGESMSDLDAAPYAGARYPMESRLDGRIFVGFHTDVGIGDAVIEPVETIKGRNWLELPE